ncbi:MAG: phosphoenolpyruvate carboxylase [Rhodopseudomonas palustris]|nr:phosphoenolpyruvate carboxylase [Rhodopseudomonas palustris]
MIRDALDKLAALLNGLPVSEAVRIVRAFSYFSHLANIAEDQTPHPPDAAPATAPRRGRGAWRRSGACARGGFQRQARCANSSIRR